MTAVLAASVEQHLVACGECRALRSTSTRRVWAGSGPRSSTGSRPRGSACSNAACGRSGSATPTARLVAATPVAARRLGGSAVLLLLMMAWLAGHASPRGTALFVTLAPILPLAGVALSFGHSTDPTLEIAAASPYSMVRLLAAAHRLRGGDHHRARDRAGAVPARRRPPHRRLAAAALAMCSIVLAVAHRVEPHVAALALSAGSGPRSPPGATPSATPLLARPHAHRAGCSAWSCLVAAGATSSPTSTTWPSPQEDRMTPLAPPTVEAHDLVRRYGPLPRPRRPGPHHPARCHRAARTQRRRQDHPAPRAGHRLPRTTRAACASWARTRGRGPAGCRIRRALGYLPQDVGFHPGFTAFEAVDYVAVLKEHTSTRARHDEVRRVLDLVGLGDAATKKVRALSGGMRRRLGLAQALLGDPRAAGARRADGRARPRAADPVPRPGLRGGRRTHRRAVDPPDRGRGCTRSHVVVVNHGRHCSPGSVAEMTSAPKDGSGSTRPGTLAPSAAGASPRSATTTSAIRRPARS